MIRLPSLLKKKMYIVMCIYFFNILNFLSENFNFITDAKSFTSMVSVGWGLFNMVGGL